MTQSFGMLAPGALDRAVIAATSRLPNNWLGLRLAIGLRRIVTMRMDGDPGRDVTRWGLRLRLHPRRNGCEKGVLFTPQMYEVPERAELAASIARARHEGRDVVFVDIGANVGLFSFLVTADAKGRARILAIEPEPENLRRLRFNVAANPGAPIEVIACALGETDGEALLETGIRDKGGSRVLYGAKPTALTTVVACRTLAGVLREAGVTRIDALKIDVEGSEDRILLPFFRNTEPALWPSLLLIEDAREAWRDDLFAALGGFGYTVSSRSKLNVMLRLTSPPQRGDEEST